MITSLIFLTFLRVLIVMLSGETAIRYALWWHETRQLPNALLTQLMLGVGLVHVALAAMIGFSLLSPLGLNPPIVDLKWFVSFSLVILAGTFYHLIPCWRISCGLSWGWVAANLIGRIFCALAISYAFILFLGHLR